MNNARVSIIIPVHNQKDLLQKCIDSIYEKSGTTQFQIVIVNDGSDEHTTTYCQKLLDNNIVQFVVHNEIAKGFTEACNQGILQSKDFDYVCFLNSDTKIITKNWLDIILDYWSKNDTVGCLGVLSNNASTQSVGSRIVEESKIQQYGDWITSFSNKKYRETCFINGFCFFISSKVLQRIGPFDNEMFPHYGSEDDYVLRIKQKKYKLVIIDDVYIYHYSNQSYKEKRKELTNYSYPTLIEKWGEKLVRQYAISSQKVLSYLRIKLLNSSFYSEENCCDIIVVVHNALSYVKKCIESIYKYTTNFNLIIVDNASEIETKEYLSTLKSAKVITNEKNFGFGYANNQALRASNSKYVCFLNSDTIVTSSWLSRLITTLENSDAGLVGPVTNNVSSEIQRVDFVGENILDIDIFTQKHFMSIKDKITETNRLVGFCFLTKRKILEQTGLFDIRYRFNFEDDDLCLRIIEKGYKIVCASGVFIYHFGSKSFKEKTGFFKQMIEESKDKHVKKWYRSGRLKKLNENKHKFSIIYIVASNSPSGGVKVIFEHANRLKDRGYDVSIWCNENALDTWFNLYAPISYFKNASEIPESDIAIGTYFSTLPVLQNVKAKIKLHLCQGYEALLYDKQALVQTIKDDYRKIKEKIVVSTWLKMLIDTEYEVDSYYVPNGIDEYVFPFSEHKKNKIPRVLIVGNYGLEFKGVSFAIEAAKEYSRIEKIDIVRLASEKTKYDKYFEYHDMTTMSQEEIANVYSSCDVTINSSFKVEGFSLPPLESMACGTPVITTDCGGVMEYVVHNINAIVVEPGSSDSILIALKDFFDDPSIYSKLAKEGLKTVNYYLWYNSIDMLEGLLNRLYQNYYERFKESLSVCMIVKNESYCLAQCLESIKNIASEIIIVDTGSIDDTVRIAKQYGAKIFHFEWNKNFSDARNFSLEQATQTWTLVLDADEVISSKDISKLKEVLNGPQVAYVFCTRNYVKTKNAEGLNINVGEYKEQEQDYVGWCRSDKVRLFPTNDSIRFSGEIHELVEKSIKSIGLGMRMCEVPIHHYSKLSAKKNKEYLELSKQKALSTNDVKALYELGTQYMVLNNYDEAVVIWRKLSEQDPTNEDIFAHLGTTFNLIGDFDQAEKNFLKSIELKQTEYAVKHLGICYAKQDRILDAYEAFRKIVYKTEDFKTLTDFAFCCNSLKKFDESICILEKCLKINKNETINTGLLEIAYNEKGILLASKNYFKKSINMFRRALSINPDYNAAKTNLTLLNKLIDSPRFSKKFIK